MISVQRNIPKTGKLQLHRKAPASLPSDTHDTLHFVLLPWHWISPWSIRQMNTCQVIAVRINQESIFNDYDVSPLIFSFQANGCAFLCWTLIAARPWTPCERTFELSSSFLWTTSCGHFPGQFKFSAGKGQWPWTTYVTPLCPSFFTLKEGQQQLIINIVRIQWNNVWKELSALGQAEAHPTKIYWVSPMCQTCFQLLEMPEEQTQAQFLLSWSVQSSWGFGC